MYNTNNIKNARLNAKMSQLDIANLLNVSRSSYAMWESNNNIFPIKRLIEFCNILNISIDYALNLTTKNKQNNKEFNIDTYRERLINFRKENNLTQEKLAKILNTNKSVICNYEKGRNIIATPFLYMICEKYNISADYLLSRTNEKNIESN